MHDEPEFMNIRTLAKWQHEYLAGLGMRTTMPNMVTAQGRSIFDVTVAMGIPPELHTFDPPNSYMGPKEPKFTPLTPIKFV